MISPFDYLLQYFPYSPTPQQIVLFQKLQDFINAKGPHHHTFLLKGYAGTGKTTVIQTLSRTLAKLKYRIVLLAPTGRAAKVVAKHTRRKAYTIHRQIYKQVQHPYSGAVTFKLRKNYYTRTVFIVDEASMVSHISEGGRDPMLTDLIRYVFTDTTNKLVIVGDTAQLPPVGQALSAMLHADVLQYAYDLRVETYELTDVVRQGAQSGILANATALRDALKQATPTITLNVQKYSDTFSMGPEKLTDGLSYAYLKYDITDTLLLCPSNREAVRYNQLIRSSILHRPETVTEGDLLMVARNNYHVLPKPNRLSFLANGEFVEVVEVKEIEHRYHLRFATLLLRLPDYPKQAAFSCKVMLDTLESELPALSDQDNRALYEAAAQEYTHIEQNSRRLKAIRKDLYLNALQVKYAYALTGHKAQGGQWKAVFVDPGYLSSASPSPDTLRWLYTALTRASDELFLINANPEWFDFLEG